ncbi:MAG: HDOD domain-containing protein [Gammaproteobacteria bacterium]|nr:MAG: HDOD domain-containing protein [Gammaproteobacteria bacterium]
MLGGKAQRTRLCMDIFVGRQPIFNRERRIVAHELLFRDAGDASGAVFEDGDAATREVLESAFVDIGLDRLAGRQPVFLNLTRNYLLHPPPLPPKQVVYEILEDIDFVDDIQRAIARLAADGYRLALDDYVAEKADPAVLSRVHIIKLDVLAHGPRELERIVASLRDYPARLLAEKVEDEATWTRCLALGFDLFQGYWFSRPQVIRGRRLQANQAIVLQLLRLVHKPAPDFRELEKLISQDVNLSYKLLRMINSPYYGLSRKIESVRRALVYIGQDALRGWLSMLSVRELDEQNRGLTGLALTRARMCALLCPNEQERDAWFTVGLFSVLDQLTGLPMEEVLAGLPLSDDVVAALLHGLGPMGEALACAIALENPRETEPQDRRTAGLSAEEVAARYLEAVAWAQEQMQALG